MYLRNIITQAADDFIVELQHFVPLKLRPAHEQGFVSGQDGKSEPVPSSPLVLFSCTMLPKNAAGVL